MIKVLFVCWGNICRSPMGEYILRDMVAKRGLEDQFYIESAATSTEEIGNPVYPPARAELAKHGIDCTGHHARQVRRSDYDKFDYILAMEDANVRDILEITGPDTKNKIHRLLDFTEHPRNISDPWYTGNFDEAYWDIYEGCQAFLDSLNL